MNMLAPASNYQGDLAAAEALNVVRIAQQAGAKIPAPLAEAVARYAANEKQVADLMESVSDGAFGRVAAEAFASDDPLTHPGLVRAATANLLATRRHAAKSGFVLALVDAVFEANDQLTQALNVPFSAAVKQIQALAPTLKAAGLDPTQPNAGATALTRGGDVAKAYVEWREAADRLTAVAEAARRHRTYAGTWRFEFRVASEIQAWAPYAGDVPPDSDGYNAVMAARTPVQNHPDGTWGYHYDSVSPLVIVAAGYTPRLLTPKECGSWLRRFEMELTQNAERAGVAAGRPGATKSGRKVAVK